LHGHQIGDAHYGPLWTPQIDLDDGHAYLGFRDLLEARVVDKFISLGMSAQRVRAAIVLARDELGDERPLSTNRFRTDGRDIFLHVVDTDEQGRARERLLNLFKRQYEFKQFINPLLKTIDFDKRGAPLQWWPIGKRGHIVVDPSRAFGQPIESETSVPTAILDAAGRQEGITAAARIYQVPQAAIKRAMQFEADIGLRAPA
jgi:hypothetical protein